MYRLRQSAFDLKEQQTSSFRILQTGHDIPPHFFPVPTSFLVIQTETTVLNITSQSDRSS